MIPKNLIYTLGLDIGIGSIGWAVVENRLDHEQNRYRPYRLIDTGVRLFDVAEVPKTGESPATLRRTARSARRRLHRRSARLKRTKDVLIKHDLIQSNKDLNSHNEPKSNDVYTLRVNALDRKISDIDLSKCILHIMKRRGFKSSRKNIELDNGGEYKNVLEANSQRLVHGGYRSVGEMLLKDPAFVTRKRNTEDNYIGMVQRNELEAELKMILEKQSILGNSKINDQLIKELLTIFIHQLPFSNRETLMRMVGKCTLEANEYRAPKHSVTFEKFQLLQSLRNIKLYEKLHSRDEFSLHDDDIKTVYEHGFLHTRLTYTHIRKILGLPSSTRFARFKYKYTKLSDGELTDADKKLENVKFFEPRGYKAIEKAFKTTETWTTMKDNHALLDTIAEALTVNKTEAEIQRSLISANVEQRIVDICAKIPTFSKFAHLSLVALRKITPHLFTLTYDKACEKAGYDFQGQIAKKYALLPRILAQEPGEHDLKIPYIIADIRSPVVMRALTQTRRVVNAIVQKYGPPAFAHVELSRDMSRSHKDRMLLQRQMEENESERNAVITRLSTEFNIQNPTGGDILKYRLYVEQGCTCAYSLKTISVDELFDKNRTQIDHILPYSRSLNDSYANKALVLVEENQEKRNQTPLEYLRAKHGEDGDQEKAFRVWVEQRFSLDKLKRKKSNFLEEKLPDIELQGFIDRDLNDTRYVSREMKNLLENHLLFRDVDQSTRASIRRVYTFQGFFTSFMRRSLGIPKDRSESHRHHAMDAIILAVSDYTIMKRIADRYKRKELHDPTGEKIVEPWLDFRNDVLTRVYSDDLNAHSKDPHTTEKYSDILDELKPLFVSRAPNHKITGAAHKAGLLSPKELPYGVSLNAGKAVAENASMVRVDVFHKEKKYYYVPLYVADTVKKVLPNKATTGADLSKWTDMTSDYEFLFSLYPNDYIRIKDGETIAEGYYVKLHRSSAKISMRKHDQVLRNENGAIELLEKGGKTVDSIKKFSVDVFGSLHEIKSEKRLPLSKHQTLP